MLRMGGLPSKTSSEKTNNANISVQNEDKDSSNLILAADNVKDSNFNEIGSVVANTENAKIIAEKSLKEAENVIKYVDKILEDFNNDEKVFKTENNDIQMSSDSILENMVVNKESNDCEMNKQPISILEKYNINNTTNIDEIDKITINEEKERSTQNIISNLKKQEAKLDEIIKEICDSVSTESSSLEKSTEFREKLEEHNEDVEKQAGELRKQTKEMEKQFENIQATEIDEIKLNSDSNINFDNLLIKIKAHNGEASKLVLENEIKEKDSEDIEDHNSNKISTDEIKVGDQVLSMDVDIATNTQIKIEGQLKSIEDMLSEMDESQEKTDKVKNSEIKEGMSSSILLATLLSGKKVNTNNKQSIPCAYLKNAKIPDKRDGKIIENRIKDISELNKTKQTLKKQFLEQHTKVTNKQNRGVKYKAIIKETRRCNVKLVDIKSILNNKENSFVAPNMVDRLRQTITEKLSYKQVVRGIKNKDVVKKKDPLTGILTKSGIIKSGNQKEDRSYILVPNVSFRKLTSDTEINCDKKKTHVLAFKRIVKNIKQVILPSKDWQVKLGLSAKNKVIQVTCTDVPRNKTVQISCFKIGYEIVIRERPLRLLGAPELVETLNDLSILLNIIHRMGSNDPLLEPKIKL